MAMIPDQRSSNRTRSARLIPLSILLMVVAACASSPAPSPADPAPSEETSAPSSSIAEGAVIDDYTMHYGDVLDIRFFYNPELDVTLPIRPDGGIHLELIGEVRAQGLTPAELAARLESRYAGTLRNPEVAVILTTFVDRKVYVGGEVNTPRAIELSRDQTAFQAILEAGGFKSTAHLANIVVLRDQGTEEPLFFTLDYAEAVKYGNVDTGKGPDLTLQPNDIIFVPKTRVARWGQLVDQYFTQLVPISLSMGLTYFVGGFN